ncbi:hypothetical protein ACS0TY_004790 [Phlomoides rotata]
MAMKEQKAQVRVLDAPIPLQTSDAVMDSPKLTVKEQKAHVRAVDDDSAVAASTRENSRQVSHELQDAPNPLQSSDALTDSPVASSGSRGGFTLQFSLKDLMSRRKLRLSRLQSIGHTSGRINLKGGFAAASLELSQGVNEEGKAKALAAATSELERLFKKEDFKQIKVIGQFNLGFIIGKLDHDLFIVDQHAADEKYNYERLSQTTILNQQPLLMPRLLGQTNFEFAKTLSVVQNFQLNHMWKTAKFMSLKIQQAGLRMFMYVIFIFLVPLNLLSCYVSE